MKKISEKKIPFESKGLTKKEKEARRHEVELKRRGLYSPDAKTVDAAKKVLGTRNTDLYIHGGVNDPDEVREFIENRLIQDCMEEDAGVRLKALTLLGKLDNIGSFVKKGKVDIGDQSDDALNKMLKKMIDKVIGKPIEGKSEKVE